MQAGFIGLGKMGFNMAQQLLEHGHELVVYDLSEQAVSRMEEAGAIPAASVADLVSRLSSLRMIWLMVPAGEAGGRSDSGSSAAASGWRHCCRRGQFTVSGFTASVYGAGFPGYTVS